MPKPDTNLAAWNSMQGISTEGLSSQTVTLTESSRRSRTQNHYKVCWYQSMETNSISPTFNQVLEFLASLYLDGLEYNTISCYRSSISAYHNKLRDVPIAQNEKVSKLLMGILNKKPPQPKCLFVWDISIVINFMRVIGDNEKFAVKLLPLNLAALIVLLSPRRASEISY